MMKLTLKIKLLPTNDQAALLLQTMRVANVAYDIITKMVWREKIFNKVRFQNQVYYPLTPMCKFSSQMVIRFIAKFADAYALESKTKRKFNPLGTITYDVRLITYKPNNVIILWCLGGRQKIDFVGNNSEHFSLIKGVADPVCKIIGKPANKHFKCSNCESYMDADANASINIATLGRAINRTKKSNAMSFTITHMASGLKPNPSLRVDGWFI